VRFVDDLKRLLQTPSAGRETQFIYVLLPEDLDPQERTDVYAETLEVELRTAGLGYVSGGGSCLGEERPDGTCEVEFSGIDVEAWDQLGALQLLRVRLPALACPVGTQLHYREGGTPFEDEYDGVGWTRSRCE
jgi:hypothetical protein